ncbi:MAG TPA: flagellar basal body P-ring formation chaperone FlgA, partial [Pirellulaceae bacterium]|nr:flagellar basal body P-ring formation chaperone FlgA [Pirellulaceae bacterium]
VTHTTTAPVTKIAKHVATQANARVQRAIVQHVEDHAASTAAYTVDVELTPAQIELVAARVADVTVSGGNEPWTGAQQFTLTVRTQQGVSRIPVTAEVTQPERIVAARRALRRGEVIQASDVELQFPLPDTDTTDLPKHLEDVVGRETTHSVATGQPVDNAWLRKPVMVRRGEVVTVFARVGNVQVRTNARATEDGGKGDVIGVERIDNRQRFSAQVTGVQELEVFVSSVNVSNRGSNK